MSEMDTDMRDVDKCRSSPDRSQAHNTIMPSQTITSDSLTQLDPNHSSHSTSNGNPQNTMPAYDPRTLLNPRAASNQSGTSPARNVKTGTPHNLDEPSNLNSTSLFEKFHNVEDRSDRPVKKPRIDDSIAKEAPNNSNFQNIGSGTIVGQYLKDKRQEGHHAHAPVLPSRPAPNVAFASDQTIDLTGDDDDDVIFISESANKEVCLGKLERAYVNAHQIPFQRVGGPTGSKDMWPAIKVSFQRQLSHDSAILVNDGRGTPFGNLDPKTAYALAPMIDNKGTRLRIDAKIEPRRRRPDEKAGATSVSYQLMLIVILYAPRKFADGIGNYLSKKGIWLRIPPSHDKNVEYFNPQSPKVAKTKFANGSTGVRGAPGSAGDASSASYYTRTQEEIKNDVQNMFDNLTKSEDLPEKEPSDLITTPLLRHQKQALWFMRDRESGHIADPERDTRSLWRTRKRRNGGTKFYNIITGYEQDSRPAPELGGILADMMGLGKTLSILSLLTDTLAEAQKWASEPPGPDGFRKLQGTLLITPLSTISNWTDQIGMHLKENSIKYYVYHGTSRVNDVNELAGYDIVITSYKVAALEFGANEKKPKPMRNINWFRIVLDEAHMIRNQQTNQSQSICAFLASRRWAVTGTPVQNRLDDLGALIKFLRIKPFDEKGGFTQFIMTPFKQADPEIIPKLRLLVDSLTIRRLKNTISLPGRKDMIVRLEFSTDEKALYDWFATDSANRVKALTANRESGIGGKAYAHVLRAILRLRLICAHGSELLSDEDMKLTEGITYGNAIDLGDDDDEEKPALSKKQAYDMLQLMRESDDDRCEECNNKIGEENPDDDEAKTANTVGHMTPCFHILCPNCLPKFKEKAFPRATSDGYMTCPSCEQYVRLAFFDLNNDEMQQDEENREQLKNNPKLAKQLSRYHAPHTKTKMLMHHLMQDEELSAQHPDERPIKSVVFSGWTTHLDLIEHAFRSNMPTVGYTRLDGRMSRAARAHAITVFRDDPSVRIILISLTAGGLGLNLTTASRVYVMEPQFNPAAEAQAVDRVHRLGQDRDVVIRRFIMNQSFEEKMLELQAKKMQLAEISMGQGVSRGKAGREEESRRKLEDLRSLFK